MVRIRKPSSSDTFTLVTSMNSSDERNRYVESLPQRIDGNAQTEVVFLHNQEKVPFRTIMTQLMLKTASNGIINSAGIQVSKVCVEILQSLEINQSINYLNGRPHGWSTVDVL